jgi:hypothetical protein
MKKINIFRSYDNGVSICIALPNGSFSEDFIFFEDVIIYLFDSFFPQHFDYSLENQTIILINLMNNYELEKKFSGEASIDFLVHILSKEKIFLDQVRYFKKPIKFERVIKTLRYQFTILNEENKWVPFSPEFRFEDEVFDFLYFMYINYLINDENYNAYLKKLQKITIFRDTYMGGMMLSNNLKFNGSRIYPTKFD